MCKVTREARIAQQHAQHAVARTHVTSETDRILRHVDARITRVETSRRNDILLALPAALTPIAPLLLPAPAATVTVTVLAFPCIYKIMRKL